MRQLTASLNVWLPDIIQDKIDWQIDPLTKWLNDWLIDKEIINWLINSLLMSPLTAMISLNQLADGQTLIALRREWLVDWSTCRMTVWLTVIYTQNAAAAVSIVSSLSLAAWLHPQFEISLWHLFKLPQDLNARAVDKDADMEDDMVMDTDTNGTRRRRGWFSRGCPEPIKAAFHVPTKAKLHSNNRAAWAEVLIHRYPVESDLWRRCNEETNVDF